MLATILLLLTISNPDILEITRPKSSISDTYLCSAEEMNCQAIVRFLVAHAKESIYFQDAPIENKWIRQAFFDAHEKAIKMGGIVKVTQPDAIDFLAGNDISGWIDRSTHKMKRFIIIDQKIVVTGAFNFTGEDCNNAEAIEVYSDITVTSIYINEYLKHRNHSTKIVVDKD